MAVESVNNNHSRSYVIGGSIIGGGIAGAGTAYLSKPFFKNAQPTDEFVRTVIVNSLDADLKKSVMLDDSIEFMQKAMKTDDSKQISKIAESLMKRYSKELGEGEIELLAEIKNETNIQTQKSKINELFCTDVENKLNSIRNRILSSWDNNAKKFAGKGAIYDNIRDAAAGIRLKYALKYGAIGAVVLGLGALLLTGNKPPENPQSINTQV